MTTYAIVDTANLFARCQFAVKGDSFTKAGMALHIVFRALRRLHQDMSVDHMVFCIEGRSWRYDVYPAYKRKRKLDRLNKTDAEKEEDEVFYSVLQSLIAFLAEKTNCTVLQSDGVEGDDFVARFVQLHPHDQHVILSGDSDFIQLLAPNVCIVDGVNERIIRTDSVTDYKGNNYVFHVDPSKGKLKVGKTIEEAEQAHNKAERERKKTLAELVKADPKTLTKKQLVESQQPYVKKEFSFEVEPAWWEKALFVKLIRGDSGDGIFSSYPGVRFEGTKSKIGIREAWEDRFDKGYAWNNFMLSTWEKPDGLNADGSARIAQVRVSDEFAFNELLIDLTKQPEAVKDLASTVIIQAIQKEKVKNVGINFLRFCKAQGLVNVGAEAQDHAYYLNRPYA